ncbi:MAG TPA: hypothetical protein VFS88_10275 [Micavibrio sp.]|nr:hypothetical protein [Micavibrio sp.]
MTYEIKEDLIKDLGIYGIKVAITLNAGAFGLVLSNFPSAALPKTVLLAYLFGLLAAIVQIAVTYVKAQISIVNPNLPSFLNHMLWMTLPIGVSYFLFFAASVLAIFTL